MNNNALEFLSYIKSTMSKESIAVLYGANNIQYEKCELFNDYIHSLIILVFDTYMGDEFTDSTQQINHFKWCWDQNVKNFEKENIHIDSNELFQYFLEFMTEVYYKRTDKTGNPNTHANILKLWKHLFNYGSLKSNADMDTLVQIYRIFEKSIKNQ